MKQGTLVSASAVLEMLAEKERERQRESVDERIKKAMAKSARLFPECFCFKEEE